MLEEGAAAPEFTLPDQGENPVTLSDFAGRTVILYFYPAADTPGCTQQACGVRDHLDDYAAAQAVVIGISPDPVDVVKRFHDKHSLNFTLLADEDRTVCERYGVVTSGDAIQRSTFIVDGEGRIVRALPRVSPRSHDEKVLTALVELDMA